MKDLSLTNCMTIPVKHIVTILKTAYQHMFYNRRYLMTDHVLILPTHLWRLIES